MQIQPYLFFDGRCEEAIAFYRRALGAEAGMLMRFGESPDPLPPDLLPPGSENKVAHSGSVVVLPVGRFMGHFTDARGLPPEAKRHQRMDDRSVPTLSANSMARR